MHSTVFKISANVAVVIVVRRVSYEESETGRAIHITDKFAKNDFEF